jgi:hypothetical protein
MFYQNKEDVRTCFHKAKTGLAQVNINISVGIWWETISHQMELNKLK